MESTPAEVEVSRSPDFQADHASRLVSRLRRITTSGLYVPEIDGLRFIAIISVVLYHISVQTRIGADAGAQHNLFWLAVSNGARGVPLFFAISGFILGLPFANHFLRWKAPVRLKSYFLRRVTRLEPPYILTTIVRSVIFVLLIHKPLRTILPSMMASLFYVHNLVFAHSSYVNPPAWSLEVEIQFYCLAPLLAWLYFRMTSSLQRRSIGVAVILVGCAAHDYLADISPRLGMSILCNLQYFLAGFLLVDLYVTDWDKLRKHLLWDMASLVCWAWIFLDTENRVHYFLPLLIVVAYVAAFKGPISSRFFRLTWIALFGGMCYSIYLTHNLAITAVDTGFRKLPHWQFTGGWEGAVLIYIVSIIAAAVLGLLLYLAVERPCMDKNWPVKVFQLARRRIWAREQDAA